MLPLEHPHIANHNPCRDDGSEQVGGGHGEPNAVELEKVGQQPEHGQEEDELAGEREEDADLNLADALEEVGGDHLIANYWSTFRASIHTAYRDRKIKENPNGFLERIETIPTDKEHLSQDEVIRLASTPCSAPALKRAFLFSCLTALRKSDIKKLTWEEIQPYGSDGVMYVTTRMQKTKDIVHNPISEEALELIGYSPDKRGKVFPDFKDSMTQAPLKNWLKDAGITKHISYHCSRHSFACLQLDAGTSIAVVQRYLGHKNVATTEVYAKISDAQKRASVGCITLKK